MHPPRFSETTTCIVIKYLDTANLQISGTVTVVQAFILSNKKKKTLCGFSMGSNQYWARRVYDLCVYFITGTPQGSTESGFIEQPGIEPATPGLQDIGLSPTPWWLLSKDWLIFM